MHDADYCSETFPSFETVQSASNPSARNYCDFRAIALHYLSCEVCTTCKQNEISFWLEHLFSDAKTASTESKFREIEAFIWLVKRLYRNAAAFIVGCLSLFKFNSFSQPTSFNYGMAMKFA
jgi:hypothetical protein